MQKVEGSNPISRFASNPLHLGRSPLGGEIKPPPHIASILGTTRHVHKFWSSSRQPQLRLELGDLFDHPVEIGTGEGPLEGPGDLGVVVLEGELAEGAEVVGGECRWKRGWAVSQRSDCKACPLAR